MSSVEVSNKWKDSGSDLFYGVIYLIAIQVVGTLFYILFKVMGSGLPLFDFGPWVHPLETTIIVATTALMFGVSFYFGFRAKRKTGRLSGVLYILIMLLQSSVMVYLSWTIFRPNLIVPLRVTLFISFWSTAFIYLPIKGLFNCGVRYFSLPNQEREFFRDYFEYYFQLFSRHFLFPVSFLLHWLVLCAASLAILEHYQGEASLFNSPERLIALWPAAAVLAMISFFMSAALSAKYEKWIFGRPSNPNDYN